MSGFSGSRRTPARKAADHRLEQALNGLHASNAERALARLSFNAALGRKRPLTFNGAHKGALKAVAEARRDTAARLADTGADQA